MSHPLNEAEVSCTNSLALLKNFHVIPKETMEEITTKVTKLLKNISISKKKVMMRSAKGATLSEKVKMSALNLEKTVKEVSESQDSTIIATLSHQIRELELHVSNVVTYWHSFEATLT